jgi:CDP-diacylglycerol--inositol 3-phosphatidyltransferase
MPWLLLALSSPFMLFKQYMNVIQLVEASRWLAQGDVEMRREAKLNDLIDVQS